MYPIYSLLKADPGLPQVVFRSFQTAKKIYLAYLEAGENFPSANETAIAVKQVVADPFPFGISANRKAVATIVQFAVDQQIIPTKLSPEDVFDPGTVDLE